MNDANSPLLCKADALLSQKITAKKPVIAAWGLMNAGKSYLLNILTNHIEHEFFKTNDIRETAELKKFETKDFIFLDTPGLDANSEDQILAQQGMGQADVVLFVHQTLGELDKIEIDYLRKLKDSFGAYAEQNIILVLSKSDKEPADKVTEIKQRIVEQCSQDLKFIPSCYVVSCSRFRAGVEKKKDGLIRMSHVNELVQHLDFLKTNVSDVQRERQLIMVNEILSEFIKAEKRLHIKSSQESQKIDKNFQSFNQLMNEYQAGLNETLIKYTSV